MVAKGDPRKIEHCSGGIDPDERPARLSFGRHFEFKAATGAENKHLGIRWMRVPRGEASPCAACQRSRAPCAAGFQRSGRQPADQRTRSCLYPSISIEVVNGCSGSRTTTCSRRGKVVRPSTRGSNGSETNPGATSNRANCRSSAPVVLVVIWETVGSASRRRVRNQVSLESSVGGKRPSVMRSTPATAAI